MLEEHIENSKARSAFLMAEYKPENLTRLITVKRELDKAVLEKMKLSQVFTVVLFLFHAHKYYRSIIKKEMHDPAIVRG